MSDSKTSCYECGHLEVGMYSCIFLLFTLLFLSIFSIFKFAGWPKRAFIACASERFPEGYCYVLSLSRSLTS